MFEEMDEAASVHGLRRWSTASFLSVNFLRPSNIWKAASTSENRIELPERLAITVWRIAMATSAAAADSQDHLARIRQEQKDVADHAREQVGHVASPQARALFETMAEVLDGAYEHSAQRSEPA
jgi:hypothetical protein